MRGSGKQENWEEEADPEWEYISWTLKFSKSPALEGLRTRNGGFWSCQESAGAYRRFVHMQLLTELEVEGGFAVVLCASQGAAVCFQGISRLRSVYLSTPGAVVETALISSCRNWMCTSNWCSKLLSYKDQSRCLFILELTVTEICQQIKMLHRNEIK